MNAEPRYKVGAIAAGPMFDQGKHWMVVSPSGAILGYYETQEEAQRKADSLNRKASH